MSQQNIYEQIFADAVRAAVSSMNAEQIHNLSVGGYLDIREGLQNQ